MSLFDKIKKMFSTGGKKPEQVEISKPEPVKKSDSPSPSVGMTMEQNNLDKHMMSNLQHFLALLRLDMLVCYGVYNLNLDPDDDSAFVSLNGFGVGMGPAYTLYGAYKDIDRRMGGNWSFVKFRCEAKENKLSPIAKSPFFEMRKWEEIRKTVLMDLLKETGSNAPISSDLNDKKNFYALCTNICNIKLKQLQSSIR